MHRDRLDVVRERLRHARPVNGGDRYAVDVDVDVDVDVRWHYSALPAGDTSAPDYPK